MQDKIKNELKQAMLSRDTEKTNTLRMLSSAITNEMVSEARIKAGNSPETPLTDEEVMKVLKREVKKRKDSIQQFVLAGREELAEDERVELNILQEFLPPQLTREEITTKITEKLAEHSIDPAKKGQFMGQMLKELGDGADSEIVKQVIDELVK